MKAKYFRFVVDDWNKGKHEVYRSEEFTIKLNEDLHKVLTGMIADYLGEELWCNYPFCTYSFSIVDRKNHCKIAID